MTNTITYFPPDPEKAKQLFRDITNTTARPGHIDAFYGPSNAARRALVLSTLYGYTVPKSKASWGKFRYAMYHLFGVTGDCERNREMALVNASRNGE